MTSVYQVSLILSLCLVSSNGLPPQKIKGAYYADHGEFNYMVSLANKNAAGHDHWCGGALISPKHVLTAAHCVEGAKASSVVVKAGVTNLNYLGVVRTVQRIVMHPSYHPAYPQVTDLRNDIAVLKLWDAITNFDSVSTVKLPTANPGMYSIGTSCAWGYVDDSQQMPSHLRKVDIRIVAPAKCNARNYLIQANEVCGEAQNGIANMCGGDSGSPLVSDQVIIGVTSVSYCNLGYPVVFSSVYPHLKFIEEALAR